MGWLGRRDIATKDRSKLECLLKEEQGELENDVSHLLALSLLDFAIFHGDSPLVQLKHIRTEMLPHPLSMASYLGKLY